MGTEITGKQSATRKVLIRKLFHSILSGHIVLPDVILPSLAKLAPSRPEAKLLDSETFQRAGEMASESTTLSGKVKERAPPTYHSIVSLLDSSDPLQPDFAHQTTGLLRRSTRFVTASKSAEKAKTLTEAIRFLQRLEKMSQGRYSSPDNTITVPRLSSQEV